MESNCEGRGDCIKQCSCDCYDEESNIPSEDCSCGHRNHSGYCNTECRHKCELIECHNYRICGEKRPQYILDCHNGMCIDCMLLIGKINFLNEKDDCPICTDNKDMIKISCGKHKVCLDCWKQWSQENSNKESPLTCPLCRESIWKWNKRFGN